jgi:hypothetical protein
VHVAQVFISYSRKDKDFVRKLGAALATQKRGLGGLERQSADSAVAREIFTNIEVADNFVFVISPESVASGTRMVM